MKDLVTRVIVHLVSSKNHLIRKYLYTVENEILDCTDQPFHKNLFFLKLICVPKKTKKKNGAKMYGYDIKKKSVHVLRCSLH